MLTFNFNKINVNPEGTMLDLGCGEGRHIFGVMEQFPDLKCIGLDPHIESLEKAKEGLEFLESISNRKTNFLSGSAYSLPFNDNSFDLVVCSEEYQNQPGGHLRIFKKNKLIEDITDLNFVFESSQRFHSIHSPYWWLRCFFWESQETNPLIKIYKKILERHILKKPFFLEFLDKVLNPILGKSIALYFVKK